MNPWLFFFGFFMAWPAIVLWVVLLDETIHLAKNGWDDPLTDVAALILLALITAFPSTMSLWSLIEGLS